MPDEVADISVDDARALIESGAMLLDVRELDEWRAGHAPGATHIILGDLSDHLSDLPRDRPIVCVCRSGGRSARAAKYLAGEGFRAVNLDGGMQAWHAQGQSMDSDEDVPRVL